MKAALVALALLGLAGAAWPQKPTTPAPGSALRKAILASLRVPVQKELRPPVIFVVKKLHVQNDWAFVAAEPQRPGGKPIDFRKIRAYRDLIDQGIFDGPSLYGLLRKKAGVWKTVTYVIGPTDVAWADWSERFGAPKSLLDLPQ